MNRKNLGRVALVALPFLLSLVVDLALFAAFRDRLPSRPASRFAADGAADSYVDLSTFMLITALLPVLLGALWSYMAVKGTFYGRTHHWLIAGGYAFAAFLGYVMAVSLLANVDVAEDARNATLPPWHLAAAAGVAVLAAGLGLLAARLLPAPQDPADGAGAASARRIALAPGEVAGWARSTGSWWLPLSTLALLAGAVAVLYASGWPAALPLIVIGLFLLTFSRPNVTVDRRGITVSGLFARPRIRVPLDRIETAGSQDVNALADYGGWGYRVRPGRSGVIIRSGEAIVARLAGGRDFAVTVDDSATGAALLNTLIDQRRAER